MNKKINLFLVVFFAATFVASPAQAKDYGSIFYSDDAERYLETWSSDKSWSEAVVRAQSAYNKQEYTVALENYEKAFEKGYESGQGWFNLADCYEWLGKLTPAMHAYQKAILLLEKESNSPQTLFKAYYRFGILQAEKKSWIGATEFFEKARQLNPNDAQLLFNLGVVRQKQQRWKESKMFYEAALGLDPSIKEAQTNLDNLNNKRNLPQVIISTTVLKQKTPLQLATINTLKGDDLENRIAELIQELSSGDERDEKEIHYELGLSYYTAGKYNQAIENLKKARKLEGANQVDFLLGLLYLKEGETKKGIRSYKRHIRQNPKDPLVHYNLGVLFDNSQNKPKKAVHHYRRYLQLAKERAKDADDVGRRIWLLSNSRNP